jgi:predicted lipid-binding transport protein (Tim44 family)
MKHPSFMASLLTVIILLSGCASDTNPGGLTEREGGALIGGGMGAGLGAIIGSQSGHTGAGTAIGAGAGVLAGALLGEMQRRQKENTKQEIRKEMMQQQYQPQYAPQPYSATQQAPQQQPAYTTQAAQPAQEINTMYNPRTGQTFPSRYKFDPNTGEELKPLQ